MGRREDQGKGIGRWAGGLGAAAFLFFLLKGIAWLVVPAVIAALATR